ncbi:SpoIIE family protein phosphatase [bacterium]|nr:SpoIIE family protein phosphatase [bacterium]MCI0604000.1 SpoIIE family protein phosphatase [bacterium]
MSKRLGFLILLAVIILSLRAHQIYCIFSKEYLHEAEIGFLGDVRNGHLYVKSIQEKRYTGNPTAGYLAGLKPGDEVIAIYNSRGEGKEIKSYFDLGDTWKTLRYGEAWSLKILRGGKALILSAPAGTEPPKDFRYWFINTVLIFKLPLVILFVAFFLGFAKPEDDNAFLASVFFATFSFVFGIAFQYFPPGLRDFGVLLSVTCVSFAAYLFSHFFLVFPARSILGRKFPWLLKFLLLLSVIFWVLNIAVTYSFHSSFAMFEQIDKALEPFLWLIGLIPLVVMLVGLVSLALHFVKAETKDERRKTGILLAGALFGIVPLAVFLMVYASGESIPPFWTIAALVISVGIFPLSFLYVVLRHRVLGIRLIIRRGLQYALLSRGFFVIEGFVIFAVVYLALGTLRVLNTRQFSISTTLTTAAAAFGIAIGLRKINTKAMEAMDRRFFRQAYNAQQVLTDLARGVRRLAAQPDKLFDLVTDEVSDALFPDRVAVFLREENPSGFRCHGLRVRTGYDDEIWCSPEEYKNFHFSSASFIGQQLNKFKLEEPACLEVFVNDPKSWVFALMKADTEDSLYQEKILIQRLNTKLIVPLVSGKEILGFLSLGEKLSEEAYSKQDKQLLLSVAEQTAIALEYSNLIAQVSEQEKLKRELQIATEVQARLFPQTFPPMETFEYTGYCKAARAVGGDYFDFLPLDGNRLGVALGDVSGKGISSALLMANLQALLRSGAALRGKEIDLLMNDINRLLCASTTTYKYATFFYCVYEDHQRRLVYVNAGHNPPLVFRAEGGIERLGTGGLVVGMLPDVVYKKDVVDLRTGDILLIYSDGLTEAMNAQDEEFGEERLIKVICDHSTLPVKELCDRILCEANEFAGDVPQHDDLTLVLARVL